MDKLLFRTPYGSHLYGTFTPASDFDYQCVVLPSIQSMVTGKKLETKTKRPVAANEKMIAGGTEETFHPLQIFMHDFFKGVPYALEIAFAQQNRMADHCTHSFNEIVEQLINRFLYRDMDQMLGFANAQVYRYALKGERLKYVNEFLAALNGRKGLVEDNLDIIEGFEDDKYLKLPEGRSLFMFDKEFYYKSHVKDMIDSLKKLKDKYGHRVVDASKMTGTDWKSVSHAVRVLLQAEELLTFGTMTFPRPAAEIPVLLEIKNGQVLLDEVGDFINQLKESVESVQKASKLPERCSMSEEQFQHYFEETICRLYGV